VWPRRIKVRAAAGTDPPTWPSPVGDVKEICWPIAAGVAVSIAVPMSDKLAAAGVAVLAAGCAVIAFGVVAYLLDHGDLRTVLARLRQVGWLRRTVKQHAA